MGAVSHPRADIQGENKLAEMNFETNFKMNFYPQAYGHFQEAAVHLRHALELKPDLMDAAEALKEVESLPAASVHAYTLLIIVCLVRK